MESYLILFTTPSAPDAEQALDALLAALPFGTIATILTCDGKPVGKPILTKQPADDFVVRHV